MKAFSKQHKIIVTHLGKVLLFDERGHSAPFSQLMPWMNRTEAEEEVKTSLKGVKSNTDLVKRLDGMTIQKWTTDPATYICR